MSAKWLANTSFEDGAEFRHLGRKYIKIALVKKLRAWRMLLPLSSESFVLPSKNLKIKIYDTVILLVFFMGVQSGILH
jgi:hypothetical protein